VFARFYFLIAYTTSIIFYLLFDHVIRSSAINLHLAFNLGFAHHRCRVSVQRCVWPPEMTLGEIQTYHAPWYVWFKHTTNPPQRRWPSDCLSPCSHAGTPAQARISGGGRQQWRPAVSVATCCHTSNNYLKH